jgi:hypothetical protein
MKKVMLIYLIFISVIGVAQNLTDSIKHELFDEFVNQTPKYFEKDTTFQPTSPSLQIDLTYMSSLYAVYTNRELFNYTEEEKVWLEKRIEDLAIAYFKDEKRILLGSEGGAAGCSGKLIDTFLFYDVEIVEVIFCHTCIENSKYFDFFNIFNTKMYELMHLEAPDYRTNYLMGTYVGKGKFKEETKLILMEDMSFKIWFRNEVGHFYSEGYWKNDGNQLTLQSFKSNTMYRERPSPGYDYSHFADWNFLFKNEKLSTSDFQKLKLIKIKETL